MQLLNAARVDQQTALYDNFQKFDRLLFKKKRYIASGQVVQLQNVPGVRFGFVLYFMKARGDLYVMVRSHLSTIMYYYYLFIYLLLISLSTFFFSFIFHAV